jgi:Flp pilus assembly protein TadG
MSYWLVRYFWYDADGGVVVHFALFFFPMFAPLAG